MECLALSPLKFNIWSTDWSLIRTNFFVNAHPKANVARLLQYVHWRMWWHSNSVDDMDGSSVLGSVSEYTFFQGHRELDLKMLLEDIEPESSGFIKLQLEKRNTHSGVAVNLEYDMESDFEGSGLQITVNTLSVEKLASHVEHVPMNATIGRLKKTALRILTDYEGDETHGSLCEVKNDHTAEDLLGLSVKGGNEHIDLNDEKSSELYEDMTLSELLGIDFAPHNSFFNLVFSARHNEGNTDAGDTITIEFVSDATLSKNQMAVNPSTTVEQVKVFICSAYTHALRLSPSDVKLIYKGQLIHRLDLAGNPSRIMEYVKEPQGAKLHVYINQEYTEPGPGFWSELFHNPDRFDFMNARSQQQVQDSQHQHQQQYRRESTGHAENVEILPVTSTMSSPPRPMTADTEGTAGNSTTHMNVEPSSMSPVPQHRYVTESGAPIERGRETFIECTVEGERVLIPSEKLSLWNAQLEIDDHFFPVNSQDFIISNGMVTLSPQLIQRVESSLQTQITTDKIPFPPAQAHTDNRRQEPPRISWPRVLTGLLLLAKTLYLIANNSVIPFFFVLELSTILPKKYTSLIAVLILFRTIWSTRELWDMWISYFDLNSIDESTYHEVKEHILDKRSTRLFYEDCESHPVVIDIFMASNLRQERQQLQENYTFEELNEQNGAQAWHQFLQGVGHGTIRKEPLDEFLISCLRIYEDSRAVMPHSYQESWKQLLKLAQRDAERITSPQRLPLHRRTYRELQWQINRFRRSQFTMTVLQHVVPDPLQDNLILAITKNIALFFLVFLPPIKHKVDTILEDRKRSREQHRQLHHQQQQQQQREQTAPAIDHNNDNNTLQEEILPHRPGASGAALHNVDE